jgi:hypothetical protein
LEAKNSPADIPAPSRNLNLSDSQRKTESGRDPEIGDIVAMVEAWEAADAWEIAEGV